MKVHACQLNKLTEARLKLALLYLVANRLIRENNQKFGKTFIYAYDANGNITGKSEYSYSTATNLSVPQNYLYESDRLTSWNGQTFAYDNCGNPTTYKGQTMTWERGRLLSSYKGYKERHIILAKLCIPIELRR